MDVYLNKNTMFTNIVACRTKPGGNLLCRLEMCKPTQQQFWILSNQIPTYRKLLEGLEEAARNHPHGYHLCIHLVCTPEEVATTTVRVHGFIWDVLQKTDAEAYKLKIQIGLSGQGIGRCSPSHSTLLTTEIPIFSSEPLSGFDSVHEACIGHRMYCERKRVPFDPSVLTLSNRLNSSEHLSGVVTLKLATDEQQMAPENFRINNKIFKNGLHSDVTIVAGNKAEIKCNKSFLSAHSPVFAAMFEAGMKEAKTNTIEMSDMSEDGVRAFLAYLYTWDVKVPFGSSKVALDLMKAGHKYDFPALEERMKEIFSKRVASWCEAQVALRLFLFSRNNVSGYEALKWKAIRVLQIKSGELLKSKFCKELIQEAPGVAADAAFELFAIAYPAGKT